MIKEINVINYYFCAKFFIFHPILYNKSRLIIIKLLNY
ncbi:hypothetical protein EU92_0713 [Prochlorococcus marinus str. MIT 9107]|uniref:Uncharacterized protein n=1 Tax=Prochlorococcus marinus str. MIT 9116 TaxID=167544 RepID=A0A0A1ZTZ4_PROMR|nr:hypothetical protein EU92_0713 [Prochlorococcus marinus str. MIT 9107]KGF92026.1 hypothetical protein EU93_0840 [Prochlorococcus marinus str. MIT 9116]KGF93406.1 hypothetical protein EU94_1560 [Prochlorococcus marinus str. MIT 9123]